MSGLTGGGRGGSGLEASPLVGGEGLGRGAVEIERGAPLRSWCRRCPTRHGGYGRREVMRVVFIRWIAVLHSYNGPWDTCLCAHGNETRELIKKNRVSSKNKIFESGNLES